MSGTQCCTVLKDEINGPICCLVRNYDGYPEGHGKELKEFLSDIKLVNGIPYGDKKVANGMECLAAQIIAHFKTGPGNFYLYPPGDEFTEDGDYVYIVYNKKMTICLKVLHGKEVLYDGPVKKYKVD